MESKPVLLLTGGYDYTIKSWQAHSGVCIRTMQHPESQVNCLEITPDRLLVAAAGYQQVRMYDLTTSNPESVINFDGFSKNIARVTFQEDGKWMLTGGEDGAARVWDLRSRQMQCQRVFQVGGSVNGIFLHPNQVEIAVADQLGAIHIWDLRFERNEPLDKPYIPEPEAANQDVCIDPAGNLMALVNNKGNCYVFGLRGGATTSEMTKLRVIKAHNKYLLRCKFSPDGTMLVTTSADCTARLWRTDDWTLMRTLRQDTQRWVWDAAFSADSRYIFTGSSDHYARLWNVDNGALEREYCSHQKPVTALAFRDEIVR